MHIPTKINDAFFTGKRSEKIKFVINDSVVIKSGGNKGKECAVISITQIETEVHYLVESLDGTGDIIVKQKEIELLLPSQVDSNEHS